MIECSDYIHSPVLQPLGADWPLKALWDGGGLIRMVINRSNTRFLPVKGQFY